MPLLYLNEMLEESASARVCILLLAESAESLNSLLEKKWYHGNCEDMKK